MKKKLLTKIVAVVMASIMIILGAVSVFAATQDGNGGAAYAGAGTNTFVAGMPLSEIYFVGEKFNGEPDSIEITNNDSGALQANTAGTAMRILGSELSHDKKDNEITGQYVATYKEAAILPDGSKKDVKVTVDIGRVMTAKSGAADMPDYITIYNANHSQKGVNIVTTTSSSPTASNIKFDIAVEQSISISVDGETGSFIVPVNGVNQNRNNAGSYSALRDNFGVEGYNASIETATVTSSQNVFYPTDNKTYITDDGSTFVERGGTQDVYNPEPPYSSSSGGSSGSDGNYEAGFAVYGENGLTITINAPCGTNNSANSPFSNNSYIPMGDLVHRIWSGSGPGGSIATDKKGDTTGDTMPGGSFTGDVPSGMPDTNTDAQKLMRYVIPDAKPGVTYTMTPKTGYTLEKVVVDGTTYTVPDVPEASATITNTDGDGTLTYLGGGKFTYSFDQANTKDHEIYVTWKKATADIKVSKVWNDDSKAAAANVKLVSDAGLDESEPIPQASGEVFTWTKMPIYNYDANGDATTAITYTLSEVSDPVSADYLPASWVGTDKEGGTADGGFTLTDPSKDNKCREPNDTFDATVTNTLKKDVEITKTWDDQNNKYSSRPSDIAGMFKLYNAADDAEITGITPTVTEDGTNGHKIKWSGLPAFNNDGTPITYYANETNVPAGYKPSITGKISEGGSITNTLVVKEVAITRTIKYTYLTEDGAEAHAEVVQTLPAVQKGKYEPDNPNADADGMVWTNEWEYPEGKTFPAVKNPTIDGWEAPEIAGEYTISGPDDVPPVVHVVYKKVEPVKPDVKPDINTGDNSNIGLWIMIILAAMLALAINERVRMGMRKSR